MSSSITHITVCTVKNTGSLCLLPKLVLFKITHKDARNVDGNISLEHPDPSFESLFMQPSEHTRNDTWPVTVCMGTRSSVFDQLTTCRWRGVRPVHQAPSLQQFLISYRGEPVRQMEAFHGLEASCLLDQTMLSH